jgi:hypothetical protein
VAIADERLKQFFSKQKIGAFDALKQSAQITDPKKILINNTQSKIEPLLDQTIKPALLPIKNESSHELPYDSQSIEILENSKIIKEQNPDKVLPSKPLAIREQTVIKPLAIRERAVSAPLAISEQYVSDPLSQALAKPLAKSEEIQFVDLRVFSKKERELLTLIFLQCHTNCTLLSPPISTEEIRDALQISAERVRNLIFRIAKKGGLRVDQHKSGQSAYRVFELPKSLYQWMIDHQNNRVTRPEPLASSLANPLAIPTYSNSSLINKRTITSLPEDWKCINFSALNEIGFSETQLKQLCESGQTSPDVIQESINHFAYSLEYNEKAKSYENPLTVFMGVVRKGQKWNEPNYVSPKELALRQMLEGKKKEKDRLDSMIKEIIDMDFPPWKANLSPNQIKSIVPEEILRTNIQAAITAHLRTHYVEKIALPKMERNEIEE